MGGDTPQPDLVEDQANVEANAAYRAGAPKHGGDVPAHGTTAASGAPLTPAANLAVRRAQVAE